MIISLIKKICGATKHTVKMETIKKYDYGREALTFYSINTIKLYEFILFALKFYNSFFLFLHFYAAHSEHHIWWCCQLVVFQLAKQFTEHTVNNNMNIYKRLYRHNKYSLRLRYFILYVSIYFMKIYSEKVNLGSWLLQFMYAKDSSYTLCEFGK